MTPNGYLQRTYFVVLNRGGMNFSSYFFCLAYFFLFTSPFPTLFSSSARPMGRAKLEIKYREDFRARRSTYMTRMKGLKKKATELSLLCGVDVLVASFSSELNTIEFWPKKDTPEFNRIRGRYLCSQKKKIDYSSSDQGNGNSEQQTPTPNLPMPSPSSSLPSFSPEEEMAAMEIKLKEVRDRLSFLQSVSQNENLLHQTQEEEEWLQALQQDFNLHPPSSPFLQSLPPTHIADFNPTLQQDFSFQLSDQLHPFAQFLSPLHSLNQPSSFYPSGIPCLSDFNSCDSPLRSHSDDLTWCDNLLLDHEYGS